MDSSSSSKVTVEYHDPSGLFSLISPDITSRLPLRNLLWQNATRPPRQITSLHLDFVPDAFTKNTLQPPIHRSEAEGATSIDILRSGVDARKNVAKERRHQIPGLQTSPYLRIYILRSDDKDTYKATERQKIRAWIRDNAASNSKSKSENHGAFEWLIIHVVVPDTTAASEPRWRESSAKDSDELKERKQGMKLPGKSTRTVFDKLRADFNDSSKGSLDRVAQIRLTRAQMPPDLLPTPAVATTIEETNEEREKAWNDLMGKMKSLILGPFDVRVRQYEADIAEQDTRRSMPGFNFCTFFIHKEGLAKALESIGLVEDALVIYDELSLGLETVIRDIARGSAQGTATTFAPYTEDFAERIVSQKAAAGNGSVSDNAALFGGSESHSLDIDYRDKIVRNDISVFDFFSYLFTRQKALILRMANAKSVRFSDQDGNEDLPLVSEVCWRGMSFIPSNARTLRHDLLTLRNVQRDKKAEYTLSGPDIESLVNSWMYTVAGRILKETESSSVDQFSDLSSRDSMVNGSMSNHARSDSHLPGGVSAHPHRTSSLPQHKLRQSERQNRFSLQSASENDLMSPRSSTTNDESKAGVVTSGLLELVTYRAELFMMQRKMLELLAKQRGWFAGWATLKHQAMSGMVGVDLNGDDETNGGHSEEDSSTVASKLVTPALAADLKSKEIFQKTYERLSDRAMRLYVAATQTKTAESIMGDLAILKSQQGDYEYAVSYFQHVLPLYAADGWSLMEDEALKIHALCLKELGRGEEYVTALLTLLAKACGRQTAGRPFSKIGSVDASVNLDGVFPELVDFSRSLEVETTKPAGQFFAEIRLDEEIIHLEDRDGFALRVALHHLLDDVVELDHLSARLVHADDPTIEIWLTNDHPGQLQPGKNHFILSSHAIAFGPYFVNRMVIQAGRLVFTHDFSPMQPGQLDVQGLEKSKPAHKQTWVFLYPLSHAFDADIHLAKDVHVDQTRYLEVDLSSGWNDIISIDMKLKPASAGLRLHLADVIPHGIDKSAQEQPKPGQISFGALQAESTATVKIPYSLEQAGQDILVRFDLVYRTPKGSFHITKSVRLATELPLDVDVNDIFHLDQLFSIFSVRSTRGTPLILTQAELAPSPVYAVEAPPDLGIMRVFESQPIKLVYKIARRPPADTISTKAAALALSAHYSTIDDLALGILRKSMASALDKTAFSRLSRLLLSVLRERIGGLYSRSELEMATLLGKIQVPSFEALGWEEVIKTLPASVQSDLVDWLRAWHAENKLINVGNTADFPDAQRTITISVDVPRVDYVHEVSLSMPEHSYHAEGDAILTLGEPIQIGVSVFSTRQWSKAAVFQPNQNLKKDDDATATFMLDIQADPDCWLVGQQRRVQFTAKQDKQSAFKVVLVPLRLGLQSLPNIDVQPVPAQPASDESSNSKEPEVSCETHSRSACLQFHVVRGLRSSKVDIPETSTSARPQSRPNTSATAKDGG